MGTIKLSDGLQTLVRQLGYSDHPDYQIGDEKKVVVALKSSIERYHSDPVLNRLKSELVNLYNKAVPKMIFTPGQPVKQVFDDDVERLANFIRDEMNFHKRKYYPELFDK